MILKIRSRVSDLSRLRMRKVILTKVEPFLEVLNRWDTVVKEIYPGGVGARCNYSHIAHQVDEEHSQPFIVLEIGMEAGDLTVYSAIDRMMWGDEFADDCYLDVGDLVIARVVNAPNHSARFPADLYLDRYTKPFLDEARELRKQITQKITEINEMDAKLFKLQNFQRKNAMGQPEGPVLSPQRLLQATIEHYAAPISRPFGEDSSDDVIMDSYPDPSDALKELLRKLEVKIASRYNSLQMLNSLANLYPQTSQPAAKKLSQPSANSVFPIPTQKSPPSP